MLQRRLLHTIPYLSDFKQNKKIYILFFIALMHWWRSNFSLPKPVYTGMELQRQIITCQRVKPLQLHHNTPPEAVLLFPL